ncbi:MAG: hypothetical protein ACLFV3_00385 [Phycisphaeraceae bacterium]
MRKSVDFLPLLGLSLLVTLGGCEKSETATQEQLRAAQDIFEQAEQGYVPRDRQPEDFRTYRLETLAEAEPALQEVVQQGEPSEQSLALRMLAEINQARARQLSQQAMGDYAQLAGRSGAVTGYLRAAEQAASRARKFSGNQADLISKLTTEAEEQQKRAQTLESQVESLQSRIDELTEQRNELRDQAGDLVTEAQELRDQAFLAEGDEQYDLEDEATELTRKAESLAADADQLQAQIDVLAAEQAVAQTQLELAREAIARLEQGVQAARESEQVLRESHAAAEKQRSEATEILAREFEKVWQAFQNSVDQPLGQAGQQMTQAVDRLQKASQIETVDEQAVRSELLSARVNQAQLLAKQALVTRSFGRMVGGLSQRAEGLMPEQVEQFNQVQQVLADQLEEINAQLSEVAQAGSQLAGRLAGRGGLGQVAERQVQRLEVYLGGEDATEQ